MKVREKNKILKKYFYFEFFIKICYKIFVIKYFYPK